MFVRGQVVKVVAPGRFEGKEATVAFVIPEYVLVVVHGVESAMFVEFGVREIEPV